MDCTPISPTCIKQLKCLSQINLLEGKASCVLRIQTIFKRVQKNVLLVKKKRKKCMQKIKKYKENQLENKIKCEIQIKKK